MEIKDIISSGLLELYVMGLASAEEQRDVEGWIKQYPEVAEEVKAIETGMETYAQAHAIEPDQKLKDKILASINDAPASANNNTAIVRELPAVHDNVRSVSAAWRMVAAAAILLLIASVAGNVVYYNKYDTANKDAVQAQNLLAQQQQKTESVQHDMDIVQDPNSMPVALKETGATPGTKAKIYWMQNSGEVMIDASSLPDAPAGKQYQFWAIVDGKPVDGGMIITDDKGKKYHMQKMKSFGKAEAFAISLEKQGGNPTPTAVVSMGKII